MAESEKMLSRIADFEQKIPSVAFSLLYLSLHKLPPPMSEVLPSGSISLDFSYPSGELLIWLLSLSIIAISIYTLSACYNYS